MYASISQPNVNYYHMWGVKLTSPILLVPEL